MQLKFYWSCVIIPSLQFHQCLLGKNNSYWGIHILLPPCTHRGVEKRQVIHFILENGQSVPQKRLFTLDFIAQNQTQISSFSICLRELPVCSGELQCHAVARSTETLCFSQSKLEYPVSQQSPWIRVLGYGTGCSLISLRKQNFQDLKHLNLERLI